MCFTVLGNNSLDVVEVYPFRTELSILNRIVVTWDTQTESRGWAMYIALHISKLIRSCMCNGLSQLSHYSAHQPKYHGALMTSGSD